MTPKHCTSLEMLEEEVSGLRSLIQQHRAHQDQIPSQVLFRGHACADWTLKTTLERFANRRFSIAEYNTILATTAIASGSHTGNRWEIDLQPTIQHPDVQTPPNIEFMAHARHHGFPSPLLDWTQSLYVALFFAFSEADETSSIAIYAYIQTLGVGIGGLVGHPSINLIGAYIATHKRHFLQQGQYTIAVERTNDHWFYCDHAKALAHSDGNEQDVLYKFILPGSLKKTVLRKLHEMNVTAFSLLGDENSLMSTLAYKEITLRDDDMKFDRDPSNTP